MRRSRAFSVGLLAAGLWLAGRSAPAQQIPVGLRGVPTSFVGTPFDVPVEVDLSARADLLGSFALAIRWNPAVLAFVKGQDGNFGSLTTNVDSAGGVIQLTGANPGGVGGHVVVGVGRFVPLTPGLDTFKISVTELYAARTFADLLPSAVWSDTPFCPAVGLYGDVDGNGVVNSADALAALTYAVGKSIPGNPAIGDVDGDGLTNARDALIILAAGIGLDVAAFRVLLPAPGGCAAVPLSLLDLLPGNVTMNVAQVARYTAVARDSTGAAVSVSDLSWASSDGAVATVNPLGEVTAVAPGTATISVRRPSGATAAALVTVLNRHTHWVDAFATPEEQDQLGAPELPFRTIPQAVAYAAAGDTIRVRSGRYDDRVTIDRPLVVEGDTAGGRARPVISGPGGLGTIGIEVNTPGRVELRALRLDTLGGSIYVTRADTLALSWMEFRNPRAAYYGASLYVVAAGLVSVRRSDFFGNGQYAYGNSGIWVDSATVVSVDSSFVGDQGYYGIYLQQVDSLYLRGSRIRNNAAYGVYACGSCYGATPLRAVITRNRFTQNGSGHVYFSGLGAARFDHNHTVGGGYDGVTVYGDTSLTVVTFLGDTLDSRNGAWISLYNFDSLAVDSAVVYSRYGYPYIEGGRVASIRDSRFLEVTGLAFDVDAYPRDTTRLVLRRLEFRGPDSSSCNQCGNMVSGTQVVVDGDSLSLVNFNQGLSFSNARVRLRHVALSHYSYGVRATCGSLDLANGSFSGGVYGLYFDGCASADSLRVDSATFAGHSSDALYVAGPVDASVTRLQLAGAYHGLELYCGRLHASQVILTGGTYGIYGSGCGGSDSLFVDQASVSQVDYGVYASSLPTVLTNSSFTDAGYGAYLYYAPALVQNNQVIRPSSGGIYHYWYAGASGGTRLLNNTVNCDATGSVNASGIYAYRSVAGLDTVLVQGNTVSNCRTGLEVYGGNLLTARGNSVAMAPAPIGQYGLRVDADTSAVVVGNTVTGAAAYGSLRVESAPTARVDSNLVSGAVGVAISVPGAIDSLSIRDNTVSGVAPAGCCAGNGAIVLDGSNTTNRFAQLLGNRVTATTNGLVLARNAGDTVTVLVDSNTVHGADSAGIWVLDYTRAVLRKNAVDSSGDAIRLSQFTGTPPAVVNRNNITRSRGKGVRNTNTAMVIDATGNWWNDPSGPACDTGCGVGDSVSAFVNFAPVEPIPVIDVPALAPRLLAALRAPSPAPRTAAPLGSAATPARVATVRRPVLPAVPQRIRPARPVAASPSLPDAPATQPSDPRWQRLVRSAQRAADRLRAERAERARLLERIEAELAAQERARASREAARVEKVKAVPADAGRRPQ